MSASLPDEIVSEILSPALKVPDDMFSDIDSSKSPFASMSHSVSNSSLLLVCKSWLRVATPLLYSVVIIRSKPQVRALQAALHNTPDLGRFVKKLRVEGGFGNLMHQILQQTPNISDIFVSLQIHSSDSSSGLALGLPLINPTRLIIFDDNATLLKNKAVLQLMTTLKSCARKWNNLNTIHFPYDRISMTARQDFCTSLCSLPTIQTVSFPKCHSHFVPFLAEIAKTLSLRAIEIRSELTQTSALILTDSRLNALLRYPNASSTTESLVYENETNACLPINPTFCPLISTPQPVSDLIWSRILFFVMLSRKQHPQGMKASKVLPEVNSGRLQFLLVSKLFCRLGLPHLYYYPIFHSSPQVLDRFLGALVAQSSLGQHVRKFDIESCPLYYPENIASFFHQSYNLTHVIGNDFQSMPWAAFATLAKTAGSTLQVFTSFPLTFPASRSATNHSPLIFTLFTALRSLTWSCKYPRKTVRPTFNVADEVSMVAALPALKSIRITSPEIVSVLAQMTLPSLQCVTFNVHDASVATFLDAHGTKIQQLDVCRGTISGQSCLKLCPAMTTFSCRVDAADGYDIGCSALDEGRKHAFLNQLILSKISSGGKLKDEQDWDAFFSSLDVSNLPALREVRISACEWPTTEHTIAKSVWVKWAEIFPARGLKLTDEAGTEWRPRLKTNRWA
ncbi:hypothetical protein C8R43DRAFT_1177631 [Mycena crocata]|nr:hypothetical protein C8R43DRAFT_1177631 [Mycena crocata]